MVECRLQEADTSDCYSVFSVNPSVAFTLFVRYKSCIIHIYANVVERWSREREVSQKAVRVRVSQTEGTDTNRVRDW